MQMLRQMRCWTRDFADGYLISTKNKLTIHDVDVRWSSRSALILLSPEARCVVQGQSHAVVVLGNTLQAMSLNPHRRSPRISRTCWWPPSSALCTDRCWQTAIATAVMQGLNRNEDNCSHISGCKG
eukprot:5470759-Amphidinium_carterae.1